MELPNCFPIGTVVKRPSLSVSVPGSKSITNRVLLLSSLASGVSTLRHVQFSNDSEALINALRALGISIKTDPYLQEAVVTGCQGKLPVKSAAINVKSAGTAARFLTALLAFSDGCFSLTSSEQMKKRPMKTLLQILESLSVTVSYQEQEYHFPFTLQGSSSIEQSEPLAVSVDQSTQFLSALMITGPLQKNGITLVAEGMRGSLSYVHMTKSLMNVFLSSPLSEEIQLSIPFHINPSFYKAKDFTVEPDVSGACYFFAAAALLGITVTVPLLSRKSLQGDIRFLTVLETIGCRVTEENRAVSVTGPKQGRYQGIDLIMTDFSDQAITMSVLAMFAETPTHIRKIGHIRYQECDRINAILTEIRRLGGFAVLDEEGTGIIISPVDTYHGAIVETYQDHRMAMGFSLAGLRISGISIKNPSCCEKTFPNYFTLFTQCFLST